ncbi:MAG: hypothetical protein GY699_05855 [Desulfobacteraceae bacterium]|nr:hypothetical protein [Desulfobacteraceae bacterium]
MRKISIYACNLYFMCITVLFLAGCSHYVLPKAQAVNPDEISKFKSTKTFRIINNQPSNEKTKFGNFGIGGFYGTLHEFTTEAVRLSTAELSQRGMTFDDDGEKVIKLAITKVEVWDRFVLNCLIDMDVETNSGYKTTINANKISGSGGQALWGGAITAIVTELLKNETIIDYLKE